MICGPTGPDKRHLEATRPFFYQEIGQSSLGGVSVPWCPNLPFILVEIALWELMIRTSLMALEIAVRIQAFTRTLPSAIERIKLEWLSFVLLGKEVHCIGVPDIGI